MDIFELGAALKAARIATEITQAELAARTGVSLSTISALERGSLGEIGASKLGQLFRATNMELTVKPRGQRRTLDDAYEERRLRMANGGTLQEPGTLYQRGSANPRQRVRKSKKDAAE
ncbi:helix-turn-helix transcriptional regulator [Amantichitinum ursilacus]|uniref:Helix-turn-helix protein n=1 Tax=Amantichitinum ursilacus TaxID=857265 RepID=A0A0N0GQ28_9NEIS|nr:helix-turn-helix transcriptional regulator [Amantichitinum ursilacus]KPC54412.1 helix-turn-helix protein [Amantichitinum ursilacus]